MDIGSRTACVQTLVQFLCICNLYIKTVASNFSDMILAALSHYSVNEILKRILYGHENFP